MAPMGGRQVTSGRGRTDGAATRAMRRCRNHSRRHARARARPLVRAPAQRRRRAHTPPRTAAQTLRRYPFRGGGAARHAARPRRVNADRPTPVCARYDRGHSVAHTRVRGRRCIPPNRGLPVSRGAAPARAARPRRRLAPRGRGLCAPPDPPSPVCALFFFHALAGHRTIFIPVKCARPRGTRNECLIENGTRLNTNVMKWASRGAHNDNRARIFRGARQTCGSPSVGMANLRIFFPFFFRFFRCGRTRNRNLCEACLVFFFFKRLRA